MFGSIFSPPLADTYPSLRFQVDAVNESEQATDWTHPEINNAEPKFAAHGFGEPPIPGKYSQARRVRPIRHK